MADRSLPSSDPAPPDEAGLVGTIIAGRYKVESLLGSGGVGSVYLVQHTHMRKRFALKILNAESAQVPEMVARFEREAMAMGHLEHPNITAAIDFGRAEDDSFFLVLEYLEGQRLRDALAAGRLRTARAMHIARQVGSALARSHELGVIHRDLKPENIMLITRQGDRDFVKVLDFGLAKVAAGMPEPGRGGPAEALSKQGTIFGTPRYMAPEQCVGAPVDARTDLYALGLILYEMLTGESPFAENDPLKIIRHQISTPTPPMAKAASGAVVPASLEAVGMRLTEKHPDKRYASADEVLAALAEVAEQEGILPPEPSAQLPPLPSQPGPAIKDRDTRAEPQTVASMELVVDKEPPAAPAAALSVPPSGSPSVPPSVSESQILSENALVRPREADTRPALAAPTVRALAPAASADQKTAVLPASLLAAGKGGLLQTLQARLPAAVRSVPLPLLLLTLASVLGLLVALLIRFSATG
jgi:serine/threonine-protein kinase